jgi:hypothetical protein
MTRTDILSRGPLSWHVEISKSLAVFAGGFVCALILFAFSQLPLDSALAYRKLFKELAHHADDLSLAVPAFGLQLILLLLVVWSDMFWEPLMKRIVRLVLPAIGDLGLFGYGFLMTVLLTNLLGQWEYLPGKAIAAVFLLLLSWIVMFACFRFAQQLLERQLFRGENTLSKVAFTKLGAAVLFALIFLKFETLSRFNFAYFQLIRY